MRPYVPGSGNPKAEVMLVGEHPGKYEIEAGYPFAGPSGMLLNEALDKAGLKRSELYITNVLKYPPTEDIKFNKFTDFESIDQLWLEVEQINPRVIVALGAIALYFLTGKTGITNYRGSILKSQRYGKIVVPTFNPAHILYDRVKGGGQVSEYWQKYLIDFDLARAVEILKKREWYAPPRNLLIAKSSLDVHRFLDRHSDYSRCAVDIETIACVPSCVAFSFRPSEAISIPLFQSLGTTRLTTIPTTDLVECWRMVGKALREKEIVGQNFKFDEERLASIGMPVSRFHADTMLMAHCLQPELPKSLAFLTSIYTEEPYYKDEGRDFNPKKDKIDQLFLYNAKDAAVTIEIYEALKAELEEVGLTGFYFDYVHHLHGLYSGIEARGLRVNEEQRQILVSKYEAQRTKLEEVFEDLLGFVPNVASPKDMALVVYEHLKMPHRASLGEDDLVALMANHAKRPDQKAVMQAIINLRRVRKILGTYLNAKTDHDGRMRTSYRITGTETGRTSTSILRPPVRREKIGLAFQTMSKHGDIGKDLRSMFIPDEGFVFLNADLSQAEARIVALLADDYDLLELFDSIDIHRFTAAIAFDYTITRKANSARRAIELRGEVNQAIKAINPEERFVGKFVRHGGNYAMGKHRFHIELNTAAKRFGIPIQVSEWKAGQLLARFHAFTPKIKEVFHTQVRECVANTRMLVNPYGRIRTFFDRWGDQLFKEAYAQLPQSTVADKMKTSMLELLKVMPDLQILIEAHDAILCQVPKGEEKDRAEVIKRILSSPIDFSRCSLKRGTLVIPADVEIGDNYKDMEKVA